MSEYIYGGVAIEHGAANGETRLERREEIVRCRDCRYYDQNDEPSEVYPDRYLCDLMANFLHPDGFCAWGERANFATCECGEDIELGNRESAVCPRCNRTVRA